MTHKQFPVIFIFWVLYTKVLDYSKEPDEIVVLISSAFFILILLVPVFSLAEFQYENLQSVISLAVLQIINGLLLILPVHYSNNPVDFVLGTNIKTILV
jgi:uncharacterized membrane protein